MDGDIPARADASRAPTVFVFVVVFGLSFPRRHASAMRSLVSHGVSKAAARAEAATRRRARQADAAAGRGTAVEPQEKEVRGFVSSARQVGDAAHATARSQHGDARPTPWPPPRSAYTSQLPHGHRELAGSGARRPAERGRLALAPRRVSRSTAERRSDFSRAARHGRPARRRRLGSGASRRQDLPGLLDERRSASSSRVRAARSPSSQAAERLRRLRHARRPAPRRAELPRTRRRCASASRAASSRAAAAAAAVRDELRLGRIVAMPRSA